MNTDRLLSILELILARDEREASERNQEIAARRAMAPQPEVRCGPHAESSAVGAMLDDQVIEPFDGERGSGPPSDPNAYPVMVNQPPFWYGGPPEQPVQGAINFGERIIERVVSPELGTAIPLEWLDLVDVLFDKLKDDAEAVKALDAMILNWLRIVRYEPKPGDEYEPYRMDSEGRQIGFVVEKCVKRGYTYTGKAPDPNRYIFRGGLRKPLVKLKDGLSPPAPAQPPQPETANP